MERYSSAQNGRLRAGLRIRQGHTDEVPGGGLGRPVLGCCWGLRT